MSIYLNHEKKIIFIHIVKNGGTFINNILMQFYNFKDDGHILKPKSCDLTRYIKGIDDLDDETSIIIRNNFINRNGVNMKPFTTFKSIIM